MNKLKGTVYVVTATMQISDKFSKRELVVKTDEMYPQSIIFQFANDKCSILDGIKEGEQIEVSFNLRGREWTSPQGEVKYFNTLEGWRVDRLTSAQPQNTQTPTEQNAHRFQQQQQQPQIEQQTNGDDPDLPF
jgi:hypothetical protein